MPPPQAYAFQGYWEDIGTIEAFYHANLALTNPATAQFRWGGSRLRWRFGTLSKRAEEGSGWG